MDANTQTHAIRFKWLIGVCPPTVMVFTNQNQQINATGIGFENVSINHHMKSATKKGWKICSRGHKYKGSRCPYCWRKNKNKT